MTKDKAMRTAQKRSRQHPEKTWFVVMEEQPDGTFFDVCTDYGLDTFYAGCEQIMACFEDGMFQE